MKNRPTDFAYHLTEFLGKYLPGQAGSSTNTIKSYRDSFALYLRYCRDEHGIRPEVLALDAVTSESVLGFLTWIEKSRSCSVSTRNQRLAAFHSFFGYLQIERPDNILLCQKILAIDFKTAPKRSVGYLSLEAIQRVLAQPNPETNSGLRDLALLSLLYDTGARVQEIADLTVADIRIDDPAVVRLTGKGDKSRVVPVLKETQAILSKYLNANNLTLPHFRLSPLFSNRSRQKLTRAGISYILDKYVLLAKRDMPNLFPLDVSPHNIRHSKAMHLLQSGVNLVYIRDLLGHVDIKTTEVYARADSEMKRKALEQTYTPVTPNISSTWHDNVDLMSWLQNL
jgi:site-specific recombinase XerD